ncbi:MAG: APC family permease [Parvibaculaceae bacterium]
MTESTAPSPLRRALSLPWLVFYGVGVTIGAGIFALIGEIVTVSGDHAPLAFLLAGLVAAVTGVSYAILASAYPRAAGEAIFVKLGMGEIAGRVIGLGVVAVAITSSAVIGLAFSRYVAAFAPVPEEICVVLVLAVLGGIAMIGVRISVGFAALITLLEVGTLVAIILCGLPVIMDMENLSRVVALPSTAGAWMPVFSGAFLAFFAFIGFEDIENMAEETRDPHRTVPLAIILTLVISVAIYMLVAAVAAALPDRAALTASKTPLATLFELATGRDGAPIAVMASIAMVNGILVQIVMASRVLYGMAREGMLPQWLGHVHATRRTPVNATALVVVATGAFALLVPFLQLAELTSLVMLLVFACVNLSLFLIGRRDGAPATIRRFRLLGLAGMSVALGLVVAEIAG